MALSLRVNNHRRRAFEAAQREAAALKRIERHIQAREQLDAQQRRVTRAREQLDAQQRMDRMALDIDPGRW